MNKESWQGWQYFLAIAQHGSLSSAAQQLKVSQPTLSRQLQALEQRLGHCLFNRSTQGLCLTEFGLSLLEECQSMQASAERLQRIAAGQQTSLQGSVRLAVNELLALYYLPKVLPAFMRAYPQLSLEVVVSNRASNLDKRDADVAIRMFEPRQLDLLCRKIYSLPLGFFASKAYLEQYGRPKDLAALFEHRVLGYDRDPQFEEGARQLGYEIKNHQFLFRCDFLPLQLELAKQGAGIVATHQTLAQQAGLEALVLDAQLPDLPIYLVCHRDVQYNKKIRVLMDFLADKLSDLFNGSGDQA